MGRLGRVLAITALLVVAAVWAIVAYGALSNLWADYQDSPISTYLLIGVPAIVLCAATLWAAVAVARYPTRPSSARRGRPAR